MRMPFGPNDPLRNYQATTKNFQWLIGHAIENSIGYGKYLHGEAISVGQIAAARLSARLLGLPASDVERIRAIFERAGLPVQIRLTAPQRSRLLEAMKLDKKVSAGAIKFVLADRIGKVRWGQKVPEALIKEALEMMATRNSKPETRN